MFIAKVRVTSESKWRVVGAADTEAEIRRIATIQQAKYQRATEFPIQAKVEQVDSIMFSGAVIVEMGDVTEVAIPVIKVTENFSIMPRSALGELVDQPTRRRGRPPGSKNQPKSTRESRPVSDGTPRRRGRPPGSKNRAKVYA